MINLNLSIDSLLDQFPGSSKDIVKKTVLQGGMLTPDQTEKLLTRLGEPVEQVMLRLLPIAKRFAMAPVSDYRVGAVAAADLPGNANRPALFLGANQEFPGEALNFTLHAEQSVILNAWHNGLGKISAIAVTSEPCGYCRQFLSELRDSQYISFVIQKRDTSAQIVLFPDLLPMAFAPKTQKISPGLPISDSPSLTLNPVDDGADALVSFALMAAAASYAPYTGNYAGCAVETEGLHKFSGRYAESGAFNPSVSPLQSALAMMNMSAVGRAMKIRRAVLVETPTKISQIHTTRTLLRCVAPDVHLEYHVGTGGKSVQI